MDSFVADSHNLAFHSESSGRTSFYSTGQQWSSVEEGMLQAVVQRANLPKRSTREHWQKIADDLSRAGETIGLPLRSPSSCWRKAARMGLIASREEKPAVEASRFAQASFAAPEIRALIADAFERACSAIVRELRGVA